MHLHTSIGVRVLLNFLEQLLHVSLPFKRCTIKALHGQFIQRIHSSSDNTVIFNSLTMVFNETILFDHVFYLYKT